MTGSTALGARPGWRAGPLTLAQLLLGLALFGAGEGLLVVSRLGNSPWTVLAQGVASHLGWSIGLTTIVISFVVLLAWIPLRQRPGLGSVLNAVLVGVFLNLTVDALPTHPATALRWVLIPAGIGVEAVGSGFYLRARLGPGPRDGLMAGLHRRTGHSVRVVRAALELTVVVVGWALGGTVGIGTLAFALTIGPAVQIALEVTPTMGRDGRRHRIRSGQGHRRGAPAAGDLVQARAPGPDDAVRPQRSGEDDAAADARR
jgi:uncharacterized membrane protein YczE